MFDFAVRDFLAAYISRKKDKVTERQRDRNRNRDSKTNRERDRKKEKERKKERLTERETVREIEERGGGLRHCFGNDCCKLIIGERVNAQSPEIRKNLR